MCYSVLSGLSTLLLFVLMIPYISLLYVLNLTRCDNHDFNTQYYFMFSPKFTVLSVNYFLQFHNTIWYNFSSA